MIVQILKISAIVLISLIILMLFFTHFCNSYIQRYARDFICTDPHEVEPKQVALLLGTSKYLKGGAPNPYFTYRITAAVRLYRLGKMKYILASGDNAREYYNEPLIMKEDLLAAGIPDNVIFLDYAGFRTLDSVVRAEKVFGQENMLIISQGFHLHRAVFLARVRGIQAVGYAARDVNGRWGVKTHIREYFARVKAFADVYLFHTGPKFLGEKIDIY